MPGAVLIAGDIKTNKVLVCALVGIMVQRGERERRDKTQELGQGDSRCREAGLRLLPGVKVTAPFPRRTEGGGVFSRSRNG